MLWRVSIRLIFTTTHPQRHIWDEHEEFEKIPDSKVLDYVTTSIGNLELFQKHQAKKNWLIDTVDTDFDFLLLITPFSQVGADDTDALQDISCSTGHYCLTLFFMTHTFSVGDRCGDHMWQMWSHALGVYEDTLL